MVFSIKTMSLIETVKQWIISFNEPIDFVLVSFDRDLTMSMIDQLHDEQSITRIVIPIRLINDTKGTGKDGLSLFLTKYPGRVISSSDFTENQHPCVFFGDFVNSTKLTHMRFDFHKDVELQRKYRKYCRGVLMYNYIGYPPLNGYWRHERSFQSENGRFVFLKKSVWAEMVQSIPVLHFDNSEENRINIISNVNVSLTWVNNLKIFLRHILPYFLGSDKLTEYFLSDESMIVWTRAFIHPTFNRIHGYEAIERLGDIVIKMMFNVYMVAKYKRFTETELSAYTNEYLSKFHQHYICDDLNLTNFFLGDLNVITHTLKTKTDLMETFSGAFFEVAQRLNVSLAYISSQNFITMIGEQFSFHKRMIFGMPKTRVEQILIQLGFKNGGEDFQVNHGGNYQNAFWAVAYSEKFTRFITEMKTAGYDISNLHRLQISYRPGVRTQDDVESELWEKIDDIFNRAQIDIRFAKNRKENFIVSLAVFDNNLYVLLKEKLSQQFPGYPIDQVVKRIQFESNTDDGNNYVMMYIATFEADPGSLMLRSFTKYTDTNQKSGDDYAEEVDIPMQIKNLSAVPMPIDREESGHLMQLTPYNLACYRCVHTYVLH